MKNVSDKDCKENQNTLLCLINLSENRVAFEIMGKNMVQPDRPQMKIKYNTKEYAICMPSN
jgi:hypothetical protein